MSPGGAGKVNDPATVAREYASEERFLARRLASQAELLGPLVEDTAIAAMAHRAPGRILDIGCGTGDYTERVQRELGAEVVALDLSPRMVELARARGLDARVGDIQSLPFADAEFDCVLANRVLYHLPDLDRGLAEISRVLRPDGVLVAVTYSRRHLHEIYHLIGRFPYPSSFSAENGQAVMEHHFDRIERRDVTGAARFANPDAVVALVDAHQEFGYFNGIDVAGRLRGVPFPFDATYRHALFVCHARSSP